MLTRYRTWSPVSRKFDRYLNRFWDDDSGPDCQCHPAVNISEDENAFHIDVAAPGLDKKDFNVTVDNDTLTIEASKETKSEESKGKMKRKEFSYTNFKRMFTLPENVERDKIASSYVNGVLNIELPKTEESKPKPVKEIKVS